MELAELNAKYYFLFNDLFDASPALPERHYSTVAKVLEQQYLEELDICLTELALNTGVKNFELKFRARNYLPRRVWLRWNKMAKALLNDYRADFKNFLDNWALNTKNKYKPVEEIVEDEKQKTSETTALTVAGNTAVAPTEDKHDGADG